MELTEILKALADTNRLRILNLLERRTLCVCDLEAVLGIRQSNLSRHLAKLRQSGLVAAERRALFTYYSRRLPPAPYGPAVAALCDAFRSDPAGREDRRRLAARLKASQLKCECD